MEITIQCSLSEEISYAKILQLVKTAEHFHSYILIEKEGVQINVKSLLGMCLLHDLSGTVTLRASGEDPELALNRMKELFGHQARSRDKT